MRYRLDPQPGATHYATLHGVPCYFADIDGEGASLQGTNIVADWLLTWWPAFVDTCIAGLATARSITTGEAYESPGWPICLKGPIKQ
jgi:hypothetical protein